MNNRDRVRRMIYGTLYTNDTGLPGAYAPDEINVAIESIYQFVYSQPPRQSPQDQSFIALSSAPSKRVSR